MAIETITYTEAGKGWVCFNSYIPDWMVSMNNSLYTFQNGELYQHHTNETRNEYYGTTYDSTVTPIFNQNPTVVKMFKTIELEGDSKWQADITTDADTGVVELDYYKEKEGDQFAFIRRDADTIDATATSTQGIGLLQGLGGFTLTFGFNIAAQIAVGDKAYISDGSTLDLIGSITDHTATTIVVDAIATAPSANDFIVVVKSSTAESNGARGYYMEVKLTNSETTEVELFSVSTEAFQSNQ